MKQLNPTRRIVTAPMRRGIALEPNAAMIYADQAKSGMVNLYPFGLVICSKSPWLGCSRDRKVYDIAAAAQGFVTVSLDGQKDINRKLSGTQLIYLKISNIILITKERVLNNMRYYLFKSSLT